MSGAAPDLAARRRALDPASSFIVQAPAGSGKTELLIQRCLRLLATVESPEEIVAVTFTRKAAAEMRERVLEALAAARAGKTPESDHERSTLELAAAVLARDSAAGWNLVDNPARLRIQTIDSLCASLTRQMPVLSKFGSQPDSVEDAEELYLEAARATVGLVESDEAIAQDVERLLAHLDNDAVRVEALLAGMLGRRDHWLRHVHGRDRAGLEQALQNERHDALKRVCELLPEGHRQECRALAAYVLGNLGKPAFTDCAEDWTAIARAFLTEKDGWRQRLTKAEGFPAGSPAQPWKERAGSLFAALRDSDAFRAALADMRCLPPPHYDDAQWAVLGAMTRLLPRAVAQLKLVFEARGQVDFTEVAQGALLALGEADAPSDLALALDYCIRHLLVDEFQDTSISQFELVARLTAGWEAGDGRTLFVVGDPMQSIYRFREAEVGLFLRARAAGIGSVALEPVTLAANFRSQSGIVEWVNATFVQVLAQREDIGSGSVPYARSAATRGALPGPAVTVHPFFNGARAAEAEKAVEIAVRARQEQAGGTVAILVRNRGHLRDIVSRLRAAGLRFRAVDIEELGHRPVVQDLLALARSLSHPADRLAWLAVLRAPWCGLTLSDLEALAGSPFEQTVWELMNDGARIATLSADGRARLERVREVLSASLADRFRGTLRERVAGAWFALAGPACAEGATDLEDAEIFFDYLESHEEAGGIADPLALTEGLADLYALPDVQADESLQIMTIHKAKGLEFDTVIVPGLGRAPRADDARMLLWMEQPRDGGATDLLLAPIRPSGAESDPIYDWLHQREAEKTRLESGRLLYVAATRARHRLHLLGDVRLKADDQGVLTPGEPGNRTLLSHLWPVVSPAFAAAAEQLGASGMPAEEAARESPIDQTLRRIASDWTAPPPPPRVAWVAPPDPAHMTEEIEFSWAGETARRIGSVVHRWLQRIAEDGLESWDARRVPGLRQTFMDDLAARGLSADRVEAAADRVAAVLERTLSGERGRWLLERHDAAQSELRLTGVIGEDIVTIAVDRTFTDASGTRWIIDYKTSAHEGGDAEAFLDRERERYRPQLARYAQMMRMLDARPVKLGLYFPLLDGWREWEHDAR